MKVASAVLWCGAAIGMCLITVARAANCGVRTGTVQPVDGAEINWHNRLATEIAQKDGPNVC